ncbi:MAG TPA: VanW family protein [Clostridia bacterium]
MKTEVAANLPANTGKKKSKLMIILLVFTGLMLVSASVFAYITLRYGNVYRGVHIGDLDVSGMTMSEMIELLESKYTIPASGLEITLKTDLAELSRSYPDLGVVYDVEAAAGKAFSIGRSGNVFDRLYDIAKASFKGIVVYVPQNYDESRIDDFVSEFALMAFQQVREGILLISDDSVVIKSGRHGEAVDKDEVRSLVINMIKEGKGGVIKPDVIRTETTRFDAGEAYEKIVCDPEDAYYRMENGNLVLVPHKIGRQIDREELKRIIEEHNKTENTETTLPVTYVTPEITSEKAASMLFRDELASYSTSFETRTQNEKNRMHNIALAAGKYHNYILMPGEEFSFNEVVGPRNEKTGYKSAHVFVNGRVEDGIGGGICQATSTLYNAVLLADLDVVERRSHSFIVTYVPLGQDATAYYGGTDLRFINNTGWPIKILSWVEGNKVNCVFLGTNLTPEKTVVISTKTLSHTPYKTKYVDDPTLPVGTVKKSQYGTDGYVVETYKTVKMGDKVISQKKIHTSRYKPCDEEFLVGIKQPDGTLTPGLAAQMANKAKTAAQAGTASADTQPTVDDNPAADGNTGTEPVSGGTSGASDGSPETSGNAPDTTDTPGDVQDTPEISDNDTVSME